MKKVHRVTIALLLCGAMLFARDAAAQVIDENDASPNASLFALPTPMVADAAQKLSLQKQNSPGGKLLRNTLIGAGVGATLVGILAIRTGGDCGNCEGQYAKAILSGAMYGALVGAAIRIHPSRHPSPGRPQRYATVSPRLSKHVKAVNVAVRF